MKGPWGDGNILGLDWVDVNTRVVILHSSLALCYSWGRLGKEYMRSLCIISSNGKIKSFIRKRIKCDLVLTQCRGLTAVWSRRATSEAMWFGLASKLLKEHSMNTLHVGKIEKMVLHFGVAFLNLTKSKANYLNPLG